MRPKPRLDLLERRPHPLPDRLPQHDEGSLPRRVTARHKAKESERLGLALTATPSILLRKTAELDQADLGRVQFQVELDQPRTQLHRAILRGRSWDFPAPAQGVWAHAWGL